MRAVVQRSADSSVSVSGQEVGSIDKGLVVLLGVGEEDNEKDIEYMVDKIANLRIFEDENGKINLSCLDIGGEMLVISQFTLYGDCRKGRRPSFQSAAEPGKAERYYEYFINKVKEIGINAATGDFGESMTVNISNDGPVTLILDSKKNF